MDEDDPVIIGKQKNRYEATGGHRQSVTASLLAKRKDSRAQQEAKKEESKVEDIIDD
jgi:hypothetical protein